MIGGDRNDLLDAIFSTGVTAFDTARNYLASKKSLGKWILERNMRDKIVLLSLQDAGIPLTRLYEVMMDCTPPSEMAYSKGFV